MSAKTSAKKISKLIFEQTTLPDMMMVCLNIFKKYKVIESTARGRTPLKEMNVSNNQV